MVVGPLWKYTTYTIKLLFGPLSKNSTCILQLLLVARLKAWYLDITTAVVGLFESKEFYITVSFRGPSMKFESRVLTHFSGVWGPLWKQNTYTLQLRKGGLFESRVFAYNLLCSTLYEWIMRFSPKIRKILRVTPEGGPPKRGARDKCLARLSLNRPLTIPPRSNAIFSWFEKLIYHPDNVINLVQNYWVKKYLWNAPCCK